MSSTETSIKEPVCRVKFKRGLSDVCPHSSACCMMQSAGQLCTARRQDSIRGKSAQPDSSACCCIDQKKKLQSGDVRVTRKTLIEIKGRKED